MMTDQEPCYVLLTQQVRGQQYIQPTLHATEASLFADIEKAEANGWLCLAYELSNPHYVSPALVPFARMGWVTFGNPNHYDGAGLLLRELRARCRDADMEPHQKTAVSDLEADFLAEYGEKLTEKSAVRRNMGDVIADLLSDMAPAGTVFEIRKNAGDSNYGYFPAGTQREY